MKVLGLIQTDHRQIDSFVTVAVNTVNITKYLELM